MSISPFGKRPRPKPVVLFEYPLLPAKLALEVPEPEGVVL